MSEGLLWVINVLFFPTSSFIILLDGKFQKKNQASKNFFLLKVLCSGDMSDFSMTMLRRDSQSVQNCTEIRSTEDHHNIKTRK